MNLESHSIAFKIVDLEFFLFSLHDQARIIRLLQDKFPADEICTQNLILIDLVENRMLPSKPTLIDIEILKTCVENTEWLDSPDPRDKDFKRSVIRDCAKILFDIGIEVDHLPI